MTWINFFRSKTGRFGFTLVELLVVVSLIGILASVALSIINPVKQRKMAEDGVKLSNLHKLALGIEAYANANYKYPDSLDLVDSEVAKFISKIPNDEPTLGTTYKYYPSSAYDKFALTVPKSDSTQGHCFKYWSVWGKIMTCPQFSCIAEDTVTGCQ